MDYSRKQTTARRLWGALVVLLTVGVFTCMVVNYAVSREVTWALYTAGAAVLALGVTAPLAFSGRHRFLLAVVALAILIMPFLMLVQRLASPADDWTWPVGFPIAAVSTLAVLATVILFCYTHMNRWFCAGLAALTALPITLVTDRVVALHVNTPTSVWETVINVVGVIAVAAALFYAGVRGTRRKRMGRG